MFFPGLQVGTYTVALEGFIANEVADYAVTQAVVSGGKDDTVNVLLSSFVPTISALPSTITNKTFAVTFSAVAGAAYYEVEAATDNGFVANRVDSTTGTSSQTSVTITVPTFGTYYVRVRALDGYLGGRGKPSATSSTTIAAADLAISTPTLTVSSASVTQGDTVVLDSFVVANQGNDSSNAGSIGVYLSHNATIDTIADLLLGVVNLVAVAPNTTVNEPAQRLGIPSNVAPGNYFIGVLLDKSNQTPESNEGNNAKSTAMFSVKVVFRVDSMKPVTTAAEIGAMVVAWFSDGVNPATLTDSNFKVSAGGTTLITAVRYDASTRTARLSAPLLPNSTYLATVTTGVLDTAGRQLASRAQWSFGTRTLQYLTVAQGGYLLSMSLDGGGRVHVSHTPSGFLYSTCATACTMANNWQTDTVDIHGDESSLAVESAGRLHVTYHDGGTETLKYATCSVSCMAPNSWQAVTIDSGGVNDVGKFPSLVVDATTGRLHAIYEYDGVGGGGFQYLRYSTCGAGCATAANWTSVTVDSVGLSSYGVQLRSSLAVDGTGVVHAAYYDITNSHLKYATCTSACTVAANWRTVTVDQTVGAGWTPSLAVDATGQIHVAYYNSSDNGLKYATCATGCTSAGNWQSAGIDQPVPVGGASSGPSLSVDSMGRLHVSYSFGNAIHSDLKYATCAASCLVSSSWRSALLDTETGSVGYSSSLVLDMFGRLHVSYLDSANGTLKFIE